MSTSGTLRRLGDNRVVRPLRTSRAFRFVRRAWRRSMTGREIVRIVDACDAAGVDVWLAGGWGIDALVGRQTRAHEDLDLVCQEDPETERAVLAALASLGYRPVDAPEGALALRRRLVVRGPRGRTVDVHPVHFSEPVYGPNAFTTGRVAGRQLGCLAAASQLALHAGYETRRRDQRDVQLLCDHAGLPRPPGYG